MKLVSLGLLVVAFAALSLAGCSGKDEAGAGGEVKTQAAPTNAKTQPTGAPPTGPGVLPPPPGSQPGK